MMTIASHVELHAKYVMARNSVFGSVTFDDDIKDIYKIYKLFCNLQKEFI